MNSTGFHKQFWTMNTVPGGKGDGWGLREGADRIVLKSHHGKYLCAEHDTLVANRGEAGPWEKFTPVPQKDNTIALKTAFDKYLCAEGNGTANVNRPWAREYEWFYVYKCVGEGGANAGKECLAFKSFAHNKWLVADDNTVNCNRTEVGTLEKWYGWN